jgi:hypothetical protein
MVDANSHAGRRLVTRRIVAYGLVVLCVLTLLAGLLYLMYKADPPGYTRPSDYSTEEIEQQAAQFFTQYGRFANALADERNLTPIDVEFTDEMINGHIRSRPTHEVRSQMPTWLSNPQVVFTKEAIVLMANVDHNRVEAVISVHIEPSLTDDKRLALRITSQKAGRLPLPDIVRESIGDYAAGRAKQLRVDHVAAKARDKKKAAEHLELQAAIMEAVGNLCRGNDVTLDTRPYHVELDAIELNDHRLRIVGSRVDDNQ